MQAQQGVRRQAGHDLLEQMQAVCRAAGRGGGQGVERQWDLQDSHQTPRGPPCARAPAHPAPQLTRPDQVAVQLLVPGGRAQAGHHVAQLRRRRRVQRQALHSQSMVGGQLGGGRCGASGKWEARSNVNAAPVLCAREAPAEAELGASQPCSALNLQHPPCTRVASCAMWMSGRALTAAMTAPPTTAAAAAASSSGSALKVR